MIKSETLNSGDKKQHDILALEMPVSYLGLYRATMALEQRSLKQLLKEYIKYLHVWGLK